MRLNRLVLTLASCLGLAWTIPAQAQWFGTQTGPVSRFYVFVHVDDDVEIDKAYARANEARWGDFLVRESVSRLRTKFPRASVTGGRQAGADGSLSFEPDPIVGAQPPTGVFHSLDVRVTTCEVSGLFGDGTGFCVEMRVHHYSPKNIVLAKKKEELAGSDIGVVVSALSKLIDGLRE